jgi:hypothetical protein
MAQLPVLHALHEFGLCDNASQQLCPSLHQRGLQAAMKNAGRLCGAEVSETTRTLAQGRFKALASGSPVQHYVVELEL